MRFSGQEIESILRLSSREQIRQIRLAEGLDAGPEAESAEEAAEILTQAAWHGFMLREGQILFPGEEPAPGPPARGRLRLVRKAMPLLAATAAAALLVVFFAAGFPALYQSGPAEYDLSTELRTGDWELLSAPAILKYSAKSAESEDSGYIQFFKGFALVNRKADGQLAFYPARLNADFVLSTPVDLAVYHSLSDVLVRGTRFSTDYYAGYGVIVLHEGRLAVRHHPHAATGTERNVEGPAHIVFDARELRTQALVPEAGGPATPQATPSAPTQPWQEFFLRDGSSVTGRVVSGDSESLVIVSRQGKRIVINKKELSRTRLLSQ